MDRPLNQLLTRELYAKAEGNAADFEVLHAIYVETLFRTRKPARDLRSALADLLTRAQDFFPWPSTDAAPGDGGLDDGTFQYAKGLLGYVGYRVGAQGVAPHKRRALLDDVFVLQLPRIISEEYMSEWAEPGSSCRLKKLAWSLATFARNAKRNNATRYARAIEEWESDLLHLKKAHYDSRFKFRWPSTDP